MGVLTSISLNELNQLFPSYKFLKILPTTSGIMDTTYIVFTQDTSYILKKYERDITQKIQEDIKLLNHLKSAGLNVPICLDNKDEWYIYKRLKGKQPSSIKAYHIQALARFLSQLHKQTAQIPCLSNKAVEDEVLEALRYTKTQFFAYYKKFEFLKDFTHSHNHLIHGDIFKDNTIFQGHKIGVIDFIDSSCGSLSFDVAVALIGFDTQIHHHHYIDLFLKTYNQRTRKKLTKKEVLDKMYIASHYYALKRVYKYKNTLKAKELL